MIPIIFTFILPAIILFAGIYFSINSAILRDPESTPQKKATERPFSLARTQLMWWSLIIIPCFSIYYGIHGSVIAINNSCLILLGISVGTIASAKVIDTAEIANGITRFQDGRTQCFLWDILSDASGISIHRFQAVAFNIIFGGIFIAEFFSTYKFVEFSNNELILMGISSAAYVGLKIGENSKP